eukprot:TRINITY_DN7551_c0_g1_i1.p1 TRINITY_DN7551_c0_g1~~TRINITY_DN7551_c0_g1_i1.p1  ORF type:complete len:518 (-),score=108.96 TRINITY_DN7551_c0_g1_i1:22-1575(-)
MQMSDNERRLQEEAVEKFMQGLRSQLESAIIAGDVAKAAYMAGELARQHKNLKNPSSPAPTSPTAKSPNSRPLPAPSLSTSNSSTSSLDSAGTLSPKLSTPSKTVRKDLAHTGQKGSSMLSTSSPGFGSSSQKSSPMKINGVPALPSEDPPLARSLSPGPMRPKRADAPALPARPKAATLRGLGSKGLLSKPAPPEVPTSPQQTLNPRHLANRPRSRSLDEISPPASPATSPKTPNLTRNRQKNEFAEYGDSEPPINYQSSNKSSGGSFLQSFKAKKFFPNQKFEMSDYQKRVQSFTSGSAVWPHEELSPEVFAAAGFYFCPDDRFPDSCKCYSCGVKIHGWLPKDNPRLEHKHFNRLCKEVLSWEQAPKAPSQNEGAVTKKTSKENVPSDAESKHRADLTVEEKLQSAKEREKKLVMTLAGLKKLIGFYLADPKMQKKTMDAIQEQTAELDLIRQEVAELQAQTKPQELKASNATNVATNANSSASFGDWTQHVSEEGHPYWFNMVTGESSWYPPQ